MERVLQAHVVAEDGQINAAATLVTMLVVDTQALADPAQTTVLAVEDRLVSIGEKMADIAVVLGELFLAQLVAAVLGCGLNGEAMHTHHFLDRVPVNFVSTASIVAEAACVKPTTAWATNLGLPRVVSAAEDTTCLIMV